MKGSNNNYPLLAVTIMVKNEANSIEDTLESFITPNINCFFVLDTGSTDNTVEKVKGFFSKHDIIGFVEQEPFIDFATSRNRALELTEKYFPNAHFMIMPDAEWQMHNPELLVKFCEQEKRSKTPLYLVKTIMNETEFSCARLFRVMAKNRFKGVVHETPSTITESKCPPQFFFEVKSSQHGVDKSRRRWQQDLLLLTDAHNKDKTDPRTAFYLAQTYECLGLFENAYKIYLGRSKLNGFDEENFITYFRLGYIADKLTLTDKPFTWDVAMQHYLQAFNIRPTRIEPLVKLADHYWPENIHACFLFIKHAYNIPYPKHDILFVEHRMYTYERYEIMSRCAWYQEEFQLGKDATLKALETYPEMEHLQKNLQLYTDKLNELSSQTTHT